MVVQAHLRARVLGLALLRVEGTVLMSPGRLVDPPQSPTGPALVAARSARSAPSARSARSAGRAGEDLAEAARLIDESGRALRRSSVVRANGASIR